jgi:very-short-patch-repair endonuclease
MIDDMALRHLARRQHGLVSVEQAIEAGYGRHRRGCLVDGRRWERRPGGVYRLVGSPATDGQAVMEAVLGAGPGAAANATTSASWWGIPGNSLRPFQVVRPRDHANRTGGGVDHEPSLLPPHHVVVLDDLPVVVPARALFEIAGMRRAGADNPWWIQRMERMVDNAWSLRLVSGESMHAMLEEMAQRGRPGIRVMRAVLAKRGLDYISPASALESRLVQIMEMENLPAMRRQVNVGDGVRWIGRVDFADEKLPFLVEVQSERFHRSLIDQQLDAERMTALRGAGYVVVELTDNDVWLRRGLVVDKIRAGRREAEQRVALRNAA